MDIPQSHASERAEDAGQYLGPEITIKMAPGMVCTNLKALTGLCTNYSWDLIIAV